MPTFEAKFMPGQRIWNRRNKREVSVLSVEFFPAYGEGAVPVAPFPMYKVEYVGGPQDGMVWQRHVGEEYLEEGVLNERR